MKAPRIRRPTPPRPLGKDGLRHRLRLAGVMCCGTTERDGARGTLAVRMVTCPVCLAQVAERRAAAKERGRKAGVA